VPLSPSIIQNGKAVINNQKPLNTGPTMVNLQLGDPDQAPPEKDQSFKLEDYVVMRTLGSGAYATVKLAT
jgi:hypothetical protein